MCRIKPNVCRVQSRKQKNGLNKENLPETGYENL